MRHSLFFIFLFLAFFLSGCSSLVDDSVSSDGSSPTLSYAIEFQPPSPDLLRIWRQRDQLVNTLVTLTGTLHPARWDCVMATYACPAGMYCNHCSADLAFIVDEKTFLFLHGAPNEKYISCGGVSGSDSKIIYNQQCWIKEQKKKRQDDIVKLLQPGKTYTVQGMLRKGFSDSIPDPYILDVEKIYDEQQRELYDGVAVYTPEELLSLEERSSIPGPYQKGFLRIHGVLVDLGYSTTPFIGFQAGDTKIVVYGGDKDPDQERLRGKEVTVYGKYTLYYYSGEETPHDRHIVLESQHNPDIPFVPKKPVH